MIVCNGSDEGKRAMPKMPGMQFLNPQGDFEVT
jgi:hypothetical protein